MPVIIIAAVGYNRVIGNEGHLPWPKMPRDMRFFREQTLGYRIAMGSKTLISMGGPLPGRLNLVLTRSPEKLQRYGNDVCFVDSIETVMEIAKTAKVFVIGGAEIYKQFIMHPDTQLMYITRIVANLPGDTFFPEFSIVDWKMVKCESYPVDEENQYPIRFETWLRRSPEL